MPPRQPRRHHTVPRLYLRAFADRDQVLMRQRGRTADEIRNITSVAFTRDFYGFTLGGVRYVTVENWLQRNIEDPAAPILRRVLDGQWPLTDEDRAIIGRFAAFQMLRTPLVREYMLQIDRDTAPLLWAAEVLKEALKQRDLTEDEKQQVLADARARVPAALTERADPRSFLRTMIREADRQVPRLLARSWSVARAPEPVLITSDNPVAKFFPNGRPPGFTGVAPPEADLHLPLGPNMLLVFERDGAVGEPSVRGLTAELATVANDAQALGAHRVVLRHPATPWPATLVLGPCPPRLPAPTITTRTNVAGPPTFPATYPPLHDPQTADLLRDLDAEDTVG